MGHVAGYMGFSPNFTYFEKIVVMLTSSLDGVPILQMLSVMVTSHRGPSASKLDVLPSKTHKQIELVCLLLYCYCVMESVVISLFLIIT